MDSLYNDASKMTHEVFGNQSIALDPVVLTDVIEPIALSSCITFKILTIVLFLAYTYYMYYFKGYIRSSFSATFRPKILEKLMVENSYIFETFMRFIIISGIITVSLATLRILEITNPYLTLNISANTSPDIKVFAILALITLIYLFKLTSLYLVGKLTYSDIFIASLIRYLKLNIISYTLILIPLYLLLYQSFGIWQTILLSLIAISIVLISFLLFFNSYRLFIQQKVSILYWFLYLCAVEFLPLSLVILLVCKNLPLY